MKQISYILLIVSLFCIISCYDSEPAPYGEEFNEIREKVGLIVLDSTFYKKVINPDIYQNEPIYRKRRNRPSIYDIRIPTYLHKYDFIDKESGNLVFEEDVYVSGVRKYGVEAIVNELLICRYIFEEFTGNIKESTYYMFDGPIYGGEGSIKNTWQYIYVYPVVSENQSSNRPDIVIHEQGMKYLTKPQADSILVEWGLNNL